LLVFVDEDGGGDDRRRTTTQAEFQRVSSWPPTAPELPRDCDVAAGDESMTSPSIRVPPAAAAGALV
jgi:hypothetical protein